MINSVSARSALSAKIGTTITAEQLSGKQVIVLGLMTGRGFFVLRHLLLHSIKQILRNNSGDTVGDNHIAISKLAYVTAII